METTVLQKMLEQEEEKMAALTRSDLAGSRVLESFEAIVLNSLKKLSEMDDAQAVLDSAYKGLGETPKILKRLLDEASTSRREQSARLTAVRQCLQAVQEQVDAAKKEAESKEQEESVSDRSVRKVGERPEQLKKTRKAKEPKKEEQSKTV